MLILKTLARHVELHGDEIANSIQRTSNDELQVDEGWLYPAPPISVSVYRFAVAQ
jgi:DNA-binding PadR family transcriptional regulator